MEPQVPTPHGLQPCQGLTVPAHWQRLAFLSDVHLQPTETDTHRRWVTALADLEADALFILGDLFEAWVGDDVLTDLRQGPFWLDCVGSLRAVANRMPVYYMTGNRDFLIGSNLLEATGMRRLPDPTLLAWPQTNWLLTHGDWLCTDDHAYQRFRATVRQSAWQHDFLGRPLAERLALARAMRAESASAQAEYGATGVDVSPESVNNWLSATGAQRMIHGHTHRPAHHRLQNGRERLVLSDWDATDHPPRGQILVIEAPVAPNSL